MSPKFHGQLFAQSVSISSLEGNHTPGIAFNVLVQRLDESGRIPRYNRPRRYGFGHHAACANGRVWSDLDAWEQDGIIAYKTIISDHYCTKAIAKGTHPRQTVAKEATGAIVCYEHYPLA
jgi:hypothetical protein